MLIQMVNQIEGDFVFIFPMIYPLNLINQYEQLF